jgi:hypothetical protein
MQVVIYAGQGDPRRSMALLWREDDPAERTGPGPKSQLSVDLVVETAIEVADTEGMQALSMRAVGERLGRTAMSLYTYVASKNELVELMYDHPNFVSRLEVKTTSDLEPLLGG